MRSPWENNKFAEISLKGIDERFNPKTIQQVSYLTENMNLKQADKLLDLGCGAGRHAIEFSKQGIEVTGIDISPKMLEEAKQRANSEGVEIEFIRANLSELNSLNLTHNSFDGAICLCESGIGVIGGEGKDIEFFKSVNNLLKENSYFVISCFNGLRRYLRSKDQNPRFDYINGTLLWSAKLDDEVELSEMQRLYIPSEIKLLLSIAGFKDVKIYSCNDNIHSKNKLGFDEIEMLIVAKKM